MPHLQSDGARLWYETQGSGPLFIFITGAPGTGAVFKRTAKYLSEEYTTVIYDRRGFSKSYLNGTQDYSQRLERDADDAAELIKSLGNGYPAIIFATSSGAVVGQTLLIRHPGLVDKIMLHEPPLVKALPDAEAASYGAGTKKAYDDYRAKGPIFAMNDFGKLNFTPQEAKLLADGAAAHADPYAVGNQIYWFEREVTVYPFADLKLEELEKHKGKVVWATSEEGSDLPAGRIPQILASKMGMRAVTMPAAHCGYLTEAEDFAQALKTFLE